MHERFPDRPTAGRLLADRLRAARLSDPVVLALPRGGVPVAAEVARALHAPLDLVIVRKIGAPTQPEFAVAAIAEGADDGPVVDARNLLASGADDRYLASEAQRQRREIERRRIAWRHGQEPLQLEGRTAIVVDDGIASGASVRAALAAVRQRHPARLVLAVPVAPPDVVPALRGEVDDLVCLLQPEDFCAVGAHYVDFEQVSDDEVRSILERVGRPRMSSPS